MTDKKKEIEKKYRLADRSKAAFIEQVNACHAVFIERKKEVDTYFSVSGRDSLSTKECLRVRETDAYTEITYKPPTDNHHVVKNHFTKHETNLRVPDGKEAIAFLELLGNELLVTVDKDRAYYKLDGCVIAVDTIKGAGTFVEIEVEHHDEAVGLSMVNAAAKKLGLDDASIETLPYRDVVLNSMRANTHHEHS